jgi:WD40 repeat protein
LTSLEGVLGKGTPPYFPASVSFSPDGKMLAVGYLEGRLQLWGLEEEKLIRELEGYQGEVLDLAFSPDGKILAAIFGYPDFAIQLWTVPEGERLFSISHEWTEFHKWFSRLAGKPGYRVMNEDACFWGW